MVTRLIDYLKAGQVTSLFTSLTHGGHALQQSEIAMSSLMDAWLLLQDFEGNGERNRVLYVLKARGMAHSNQIREFLISNRGIDLVDAYIGPSGVLTGSARAAQGAREKAEALAGQQEAARHKRELERKRAALEQQIAGLRSDYEAEAAELRRIDEQVGNANAPAGQRTDRIRPLAPGGCSGSGQHARQLQTESIRNENQNPKKSRAGLPAPLSQTLAAAPLRGRADAPIARGVFEPEEDLRKPPQRPLSHRRD